MKPKKQSNIEIIIAAIALVVVLFLSLKVGMAMADQAAAEAAGTTTTGMNKFLSLMEYVNARLADPSLSIEWSDKVEKALIWGAFGWLICVLMYFNSKKKYIAGKEFGTAAWGTRNDISFLFANTIKNKEIKQAKQVSTKIGRYLAKRRVVKECTKVVGKYIAKKRQEIEQWKADNMPQGKGQQQEKKKIQKEYQAKIAGLKTIRKEKMEENMAGAWKPYQLENQKKVELAEVEYQYQQKIAITSKEERDEAAKKIEEQYSKKLQSFYSGKDRIEEIKAKYENADAIFTKTESICIYNYFINNNSAVIGGSGAGKSRGLVMPNLLQAHSSYVVTDPKGEILEKVGHYLSEVKGYKIRVLNMDDKERSDCYNPFKYIHPKRAGYEERVLSLIDAIIINTDGGEKQKSSDPFWDRGEKLFLQSIFFFTCDGFPPEERNMSTVLELIKMLEIGEETDNRNSDLDEFVRIFKKKHGKDHIGVQQYEEFRGKCSGKTAKSIVITAVARFAPFRTKAVKRIFERDSMELENLGEKKTAIFVVVPPTDTTFNFIAGMLFTQMFQELQYCATQVHKHQGQRLPVPVRFILDEFANTCVIPQFVKILAYARSFGVGITIVLQSLEQIKNMYKDEWGVILDNCGTLLYLGSISHIDTLEYMSKLLGKGTFDKRTTGRTRGRSGSSSQNFDVVGRELMDTAEIRKLPKKDCLLVVNGLNPFYSEKYDYTAHPNYEFTSDANKAYSYEYEPVEPPKTEKEKQAQRNHRDNQIKGRANSRVNTIMENINREVDEIEMVFNPQLLLNRVGQAFNHIEPVQDDLARVDDGEDPEIEDQLLLDALDLNRENDKVRDILADMYANSQKRIDEITEQVERSVEEEKYEITSDLPTIAAKVVTSETDLVPVDDELQTVDDGSESEEEALLDDFELDSDEQSEVILNDFGDLSDLISSVQDCMEEAEQSDIQA